MWSHVPKAGARPGRMSRPPALRATCARAAARRPKRNHRRKLQRHARAVHFAVVMRDHVDTLQEHGLDGGLPRPEAERIIRERRIVGVQDERRTAFGMANEVGVIHDAGNGLSCPPATNKSPALSHSRRRWVASGPSSLVAHRMPTRCDSMKNRRLLNRRQEPSESHSK